MGWRHDKTSGEQKAVGYRKGRDEPHYPTGWMDADCHARTRYGKPNKIPRRGFAFAMDGAKWNVFYCYGFCVCIGLMCGAKSERRNVVIVPNHIRDAITKEVDGFIAKHPRLCSLREEMFDDLLRMYDETGVIAELHTRQSWEEQDNQVAKGGTK